MTPKAVKSEDHFLIATSNVQKVPAEISHADFWSRYFYKVHQLQQDEARKLALMKRAEQAQKKEDSISWEGIPVDKLLRNCKLLVILLCKCKNNSM